MRTEPSAGLATLGRARELALAAVGATAVGVAGGLLPLPYLAWLLGGALFVALLAAEVAFSYRPFLCALVLVLVGYAFLGKGFAYIGAGGFFVGEVAFAVGVSTLAVAAALGRLRLRPLLALPGISLLLAFLVWQAARTIPFVARYGIDALRDGALWGYAAFAVCIAALVPPDAADRLVAAYGRYLPAFLAWAPAIFLVHKLGMALPVLPGSTLQVGVKGGDIGVHLGGIAAWMLLAPTAGGGARPRRSAWLWVLWWAAWAVTASTSRAAALAALLGLAVAVVLSRRVQWGGIAFGAAIVVIVIVSSDIRATLKGGELSVGHLTESLTSIVSDDAGGGDWERLQITKEWRLRWWGTIVSYTVRGKYFWQGKGYGISLAADDGFLVGDRTVRSPHNAFMTVLARSGVPGLALWVAFLAALALWLLREAVLSPPSERHRRAFAAWGLAYLAAFLANSSFDVYLEGPMGGIWFWSVIGACWARLRGPAAGGAAAEPDGRVR